MITNVLDCRFDLTVNGEGQINIKSGCMDCYTKFSYILC